MPINKTFKQLLNEDLSLSLIIQIMLGFPAQMMLDEGIMALLFGINFIAYWVVAILIMLRAKQAYTKTDLFYLKFGILINIPLIYSACGIATYLKP